MAHRHLHRRQVLQGFSLSALAQIKAGGMAMAEQTLPDGPRHLLEDALQKAAAAFPYPVRRVPGETALQAWQRVRDEGSGWPVIVGDDEDLVMLADPLTWGAEGAPSPAALLRQAEQFRFPQDYRARMTKEASGMTALLGNPDFARLQGMIGEVLSEQGLTPADPWPAEPPADSGLTITRKIVIDGGEVKARTPDHVWIATLPTLDWTEIFARLRYGGWNACPFPHEHVAAFRHWTARYDLELVGMTFDTLNLRPRRHPTSKDEALALAYEQYEFCPDLVDQGIPLVDLAAGLMAGNWWYFWWD